MLNFVLTIPIFLTVEPRIVYAMKSIPVFNPQLHSRQFPVPLFVLLCQRSVAISFFTYPVFTPIFLIFSSSYSYFVCTISIYILVFTPLYKSYKSFAIMGSRVHYRILEFSPFFIALFSSALFFCLGDSTTLHQVSFPSYATSQTCGFVH